MRKIALLFIYFVIFSFGFCHDVFAYDTCNDTTLIVPCTFDSVDLDTVIYSNNNNCSNTDPDTLKVLFYRADKVNVTDNPTNVSLFVPTNPEHWLFGDGYWGGWYKGWWTSNYVCKGLGFGWSGVGAPPPPVIEWGLQVSPASYNFGNMTVGACSAIPTVFTLSNTGSTNINVTDIATNLTVSNNKVFELIYDWGPKPCNQSNPTITPGDNCNVGVAFCPATAGSVSDNLVVTSNDPNSPANIPMTGTGVGSSTDPNKIVAAALSMEGQLSGQSSLYLGGSGGWLTDVAGKDGKRMRDAIMIYDKWKRKDPAYVNYKENKINKMMMDSFIGSLYKPAQIKQLVDRMKEIYDGGNTLIPTDDASTLKYFSIQKQCLEWAMTIVNNAGGKGKNYQDAIKEGGVARNKVRPGMGYYEYTPGGVGIHAMIVVDTEYNKKGDLIKIRVAESNYVKGSSGTGWVNPPGAVPWERIVSVRGWIKYDWKINNNDKTIYVDYGR